MNIEEVKKETVLHDDVLQLNPETGVSMDYSNEFTLLRLAYIQGGMKSVMDFINKFHFKMKMYEERYPQSRYKNPVINDKNQAAILRINEIAAAFNNQIDNSDNPLSEENFKSIYNELIDLVYGTKHTAAYL